MSECGLSIHTSSYHVLTSTFISNWTRRVVQGNSRKMSKAENSKPSSILPSPCCPWPFRAPRLHLRPTAPTHTHTHTHTHTQFTSSVQPAALWGHCWIWVHGSLSSIAFPGLTEEKKVASSNPSSWQDPEIADFSPNLVFTPSCIGLCWKLFSC